MRCVPLPLAVLTGLAAACSAPGAATRPPTRHGLRIVVVSVDGLMPDAYMTPDAHDLKVPTLRTMAAGGAFARVESVFPTVTYPAHTTLVTGAPPGVHGITTNRPLDPLDKNQGGWRWYAEDLAVPTLWQVAQAHGLPVGIVTWPVTVGADVTYRVPEYWRAGTPDDQKLLRTLSTPGLLDEVARRHPTLWSELTPPDIEDAAQFAIAEDLMTAHDAALVLVHVWETDDAQHAHGPWSPEARAAIEHTDDLLGKLLAALEHTPEWPRTVVVVVSDHGFAAIDHEIRLNVLFAEHGLIDIDASGKTTAARVTTVASGGSAYIYTDDAAARDRLDALVAGIGPAVGRVYHHDDIVAAGGDPRAALALAAAPGYAFSDTRSGPLIAPSTSLGTHGYPPDDPRMAASFVAFGPAIAHTDLGTIRMIDIAPTLAGWLGVELGGATGKPLAAIARLAPPEPAR